MEKEQSKFSILMFPWLAHGHIFPFLELAKKLSSKNFNIYLCSTAVNLDSIRISIEKDLKNDRSIELVELQIPETPKLPPKLHTTKNLPSNLLPKLIQAFQNSSLSFIDIMNSIKPDLLIYDFCQPWAPKFALSQGIPAVYFSTSGATIFSFYHHYYSKGPSSPFPSQAIYLLDHEKIDYHARIGTLLKDADNDQFAAGVLKMSSEIVLAKSSSVVEEKYIDYLSILCEKKIVSTGPLIHDDCNDYDEEEHSEIMQWLNGKTRCSTVFISFGSEIFLSNEQIKEISKGLELCNANFIWIIRFPDEEKIITMEDALPQGFIERVKERGIVVKNWAPQTKILKHSSIGGFVSHCGWSSIIESMYYSVPIIAMPMRADQPINARLVVESGAGIEVKREENGQYLGEKIAKAIDKVIADYQFFEDFKDRAKILSEKIKQKEEEEVNEAAEQLMRLCMKNKQQV